MDRMTYISFRAREHGDPKHVARQKWEEKLMGLCTARVNRYSQQEILIEVDRERRAAPRRWPRGVLKGPYARVDAAVQVPDAEAALDGTGAVQDLQESQEAVLEEAAPDGADAESQEAARDGAGVVQDLQESQDLA